MKSGIRGECKHQKKFRVDGDMMQTRTLSSLIEKHGGLVQTGPFGSQLHQYDYTEEGVPVVMPKDLVGGRVDESTVARIPEEKAMQLSRHILKEGDIVFPRRGEISKCALIDEAQDGFLCGTGCLKIEIPKDVYSSRFLYYYLGLRNVVEWFERNAVGTTMLNLNTSIVGKVQIPDVPRDTQDRIANVLAAYDDLIENNRRRIQLLEQAARLLYKEWFVHLRFPGHEHVKIKDGLPEGWGKKKITEVCDAIGGGTPSTKNPEFWKGGDITWVVPTDVTRNDCLALIDSEKKITEAGLRSSSARLVPPDTILMTSRASVGFFALMEKEVCTNQGFINIVPHQKWLRMYILFNLLWRVEEIRSHAGGTTYKEISKGRFRKLKIVVPTKPVVQEFNDITYQILQQVRTLKKQQLALAKARDLLLPRLMNGEIAV